MSNKQKKKELKNRVITSNKTYDKISPNAHLKVIGFR